MIKRTTVSAEADDLEVLAREARRRGVTLGSLLGEAVADKAAGVRKGRHRPHVGIISVPDSIADAMEDDVEGPYASPYRR